MRILTGEELVSFNTYVDQAENLNYFLVLHVQRMILLMKLVNKSFSIRNLGRLKKQESAQMGSKGTDTIELDLFQINQTLKNEIGKDVDMIEAFLQESLRATYVTVLQYLQNVPADPTFLEAELEQHLQQVKEELQHVGQDKQGSVYQSQ